MTSTKLDPSRVARLSDRMEAHVASGSPTGLAWVVDRDGDVHAGVAGTLTRGGPLIARDTIFRISSMTKPVTAVAALILVEEGRLRLDDPIDDLLPELASPQVLARPEGPLTDTVPAERSITVRDLLTFRMGQGMDFAAHHDQPTLGALFELGLAAGPPAPAQHAPADAWLAGLGSVPLAHQPGTRWLYHTSAEVLGVLVARAAGTSLGAFMQERIFEPLGMHDTGFSVPPSSHDRFGPCFAADDDVYDPADGQWATPPPFEGGGDGLVSTVDDYLAFARMLLDGGRSEGGRLLSRPTIELMTSNHLDPVLGPDPTGAQGWGFGVGVQVRRVDASRPVGSYGWDGGLGTTWANDPTERLIGVLLTNEAWRSPAPPVVCQDFWTLASAAIAD